MERNRVERNKMERQNGENVPTAGNRIVTGLKGEDELCLPRRSGAWFSEMESASGNYSFKCLQAPEEVITSFNVRIQDHKYTRTSNKTGFFLPDFSSKEPGKKWH